ncbi:Erythritol phosphate dehydrogenase EryB [Rubellimicrobium mesophilum DSM 19309]|uniref:Glycerol-3-phosphate dehydrogenase n=1 Tax=Rubellimicrobium mesophilum DSM 19309 TaxID=442562 RepID=A0A017HT70_9RHOB|nr:Erythritol phosphate dehydrogenase EryB [Rubellimicrobium mesophilum DSM 19309]
MKDSVDLVVIGGGINGAGIARDAAGRGLSVILCEKDDLAQGTSSRSGKLVHGGLRYLEYYEFRLVREALIEREVLLNAAPHIIWPMRFVLPHSPDDRPAWLVRTGLFLYDHLGGRKKLPGTRTLDLRRDPEGAPLLDKYTRGFEYSDCWVDDARLVVLNSVSAAEKGAEVLTRTAVTSARRENGAWTVTLHDSLSGEDRVVRARAVANAAGPWVADIINRVTGSNSSRNVRLVKGSHIIVPKFWHGEHAYLVQNHDKRVIFINPYEWNKALIGTTDIPYEGRVEDVTASEEEVAYLLAAVNRYFKEKLRREDVLETFSGVRPLFDDGKGNPSAVTRDYVFDVDDTGGAVLLNIFGGKITTFTTRVGRAGHGEAQGCLSADGACLDPRRPPARGRGPRRRHRAVHGGVPRRPSVDASRAVAPLRPALRRPRHAGRGGRHLPRRIGPPFRGAALRGRGPPPPRS